MSLDLPSKVAFTVTLNYFQTWSNTKLLLSHILVHFLVKYNSIFYRQGSRSRTHWQWHEGRREIQWLYTCASLGAVLPCTPGESWETSLQHPTPWAQERPMYEPSVLIWGLGWICKCLPDMVRATSVHKQWTCFYTPFFQPCIVFISKIHRSYSQVTCLVKTLLLNLKLVDLQQP